MIGTAALLLTVPSVALTLAQPAPAAPASGLPEDLVAAIQRDLGLSPAQYLDRAETGQNLVRFADSIRGTFPGSFAGAWLDTDGTPVVGLSDGPDKAAARTAVEAAGYQVKDQQRSERTLLDQLGQVGDWIRSRPVELSGHVASASIDPVANDIALSTDAAQGQGLQLPDFLGFVRLVLGSLGSAQPPTTQPPVTTTKPPVTTTKPPVTTTKPPVTTTKPPVTTTKPPVTTTTGQPPAADAMLGGDGYNFGEHYCSLGFNATDGSGNIVNITAGHCDPNSQNAGGPDATVTTEGISAGGPRFGAFDFPHPDGVDFSTIKIDDDAIQRFENNFVRGPGGKPLAITGIADPVVGAPVCKTGVTTGYNCGVISAVNETLNNEALGITKGLFLANNICALPGDSGGPVITGTRALGISTASNNRTQAECDATSGPDIGDFDHPHEYVTPLKMILAADPGLQVLTN
ncbi:S1 family peptidase [Nocardia tengchongensis]|uniref:S1 family peptidase n=1 Tax=Nocardia tengchongensis TaxID=2055889 RepID=UPI00365B048E